MLAPSNRPSSFIYRSLSALWRTARRSVPPAVAGGSRTQVERSTHPLPRVVLTSLAALLVLAVSGFALVRTRAESSISLSPWERGGVRERSLRAVTPHPDPLPEREGS